MGLTTTNAGWKLKRVTASGNHLSAGEVLGGVLMTTAGTSTTLAFYNATTADANYLVVPTTASLTAGQFVDAIGGVIPTTTARIVANGVQMDRGFYMTVGGTGSPVFWILYK